MKLALLLLVGSLAAAAVSGQALLRPPPIPGTGADGDNVFGFVMRRHHRRQVTAVRERDEAAKVDDADDLIDSLFDLPDTSSSETAAVAAAAPGGGPSLTDAQITAFLQQKLAGFAGSGPGGLSGLSGLHTPEATAEQFSNSVNDFTQAFYSHMLASDPSMAESNVVFSPFSLHVTVAMLASGATGGSDTQRELIRALGRFRRIEGLEGRYQKLLGIYQSLEEKFMIGNKVWTAPEYGRSVRPEFVSRVGDVYRAEVEALAGDDPDAWTGQINRWVAETTRGKIDRLFDSLSADVTAVLTNAIFFKDAWTAAFEDLYDEADLARPQFHTLDGTAVRSGVQLMTRTSYDLRAKNVRFANLDSREYTLVSIPYMHDNGNRFEMVLIVPRNAPSDILVLESYMQRSLHDVTSVDNVFDRIDEELHGEGVDGGGSSQIKLVMPAFNVSTDVAVGDILRRMGVNAIFTDGDFDRLSTQPIKVSQVKHKAILQVDKEGTVGAAATGIDLTLLSGFVDGEEVLVDKPFMFVVRDKKDKVTLFTGKVMDPRQ